MSTIPMLFNYTLNDRKLFIDSPLLNQIKISKCVNKFFKMNAIFTKFSKECSFTKSLTNFSERPNAIFQTFNRYFPTNVILLKPLTNSSKPTQFCKIVNGNFKTYAILPKSFTNFQNKCH